MLPVVEVEIVEPRERSRDGGGAAGLMNDGLLTLVHLIDQNPAKSLEVLINRAITERLNEILFQAALQDGTMYRIACCQPLLKQQLVKSIRKARTTFL